jgi:hypothetical protein
MNIVDPQTMDVHFSPAGHTHISGLSTSSQYRVNSYNSVCPSASSCGVRLFNLGYTTMEVGSEAMQKLEEELPFEQVKLLLK